MKKHRNIVSFLGGFFAALALSACLTTALAASGKVSYNFCNVALDGTYLKSTRHNSSHSVVSRNPPY